MRDCTLACFLLLAAPAAADFVSRVVVRMRMRMMVGMMAKLRMERGMRRVRILRIWVGLIVENLVRVMMLMRKAMKRRKMVCWRCS